MRDFPQYFAAHPEFVQQAISMVKIVDVNDVTVKLFAAKSKDELRESLHHVFVPETREIFVGQLIAIAEGRTSFGAEVDLQTLKGDRRTALITMTLPPPPTRLDSVLVTLTDITDRKRAEYLTGHVFESSPDGMSIVSRDYRFQRVNPVYERFWGMPAGKMLGMHVAEILGTEVFDQRGKPDLDRCFAGEEINHAEWMRSVLHDQARRHGHGIIDLPLDHRSAWRPGPGDGERAARRCFSFHPAGGVSRLQHRERSCVREACVRKERHVGYRPTGARPCAADLARATGRRSRA